MRKEKFLEILRRGMSGQPEEEIQRRLSFYSEIIDDRMEEGLSEEEAVATVNSVEALVPEQAPEENAREPRKNMGLVIAGSPLWIPLVIAAGTVVFSVWISLWSVVLSLWATVAALAGGAVGGIVACGILLWDGDVSSGLLMISGTLVCAGLAILLFFVSRWATRGMVHCTGKLIGWIRLCVGRKEQVHE